METKVDSNGSLPLSHTSRESLRSQFPSTLDLIIELRNDLTTDSSSSVPSSSETSETKSSNLEATQRLRTMSIDRGRDEEMRGTDRSSARRHLLSRGADPNHVDLVLECREQERRKSTKTKTKTKTTTIASPNAGSLDLRSSLLQRCSSAELVDLVLEQRDSPLFDALLHDLSILKTPSKRSGEETKTFNGNDDDIVVTSCDHNDERGGARGGGGENPEEFESKSIEQDEGESKTETSGVSTKDEDENENENEDENEDETIFDLTGKRELMTVHAAKKIFNELDVIKLKKIKKIIFGSKSFDRPTSIIASQKIIQMTSLIHADLADTIAGRETSIGLDVLKTFGESLLVRLL